MQRISRSLEDQFFYKEDLRLMEKKRAMERMKETKEALKEVSGIQHDSVLQKLVELNIRPETVASLAMVPIIEMAWANGEMGKKEKEAVMGAVKQFGWRHGSVDYVLMERWLEHKPDPDLLHAWIHYTEYICTRMNADEVRHFKSEILSHAKAVARAGGGILGIGSISTKEKEMLKTIENAFVENNTGNV